MNPRRALASCILVVIISLALPVQALETKPWTGHPEVDPTAMSQIQTRVDRGEQAWRLDPLEAAIMQSKDYGFDPETDQYNVLFIDPMATGPGTGIAEIQVLRGKDVYIITMIQPLGSGEKSIWTTNSIRRYDELQVLYYDNSVSEDGWEGDEPDIRFYLNPNADEPDFDRSRQICIVADLGEKSTGGYSIGIRSVVRRGRVVTATVYLKNPGADEMVTQAFTNPKAYAIVDKTDLPKGETIFEFRTSDGRVFDSSLSFVNDLAEYIVRPGDTMYLIARRFAISTDRLMAMNPKVDPANLRVGTAVRLEPATPQAIRHTVRRGDTLWTISRQYGVPVWDIVWWNRLTDPNSLPVGLVLEIKR